MDYFFNRASIEPKFTDVDLARDELVELLQALATIDGMEAELPTLRLHADPWLTPLVEMGESVLTLGDVAYSLYEFDHDTADYFTTLQCMVPPDYDFTDDKIEDVLGINFDGPAPGHDECFGRATTAKDDVTLCVIGLGVLVGFRRRDLWNIDHVAFRFADQNLIIDHVAIPRHAASVIERIKLEARNQLTARGFWDAKATAFPNLTFGPDVEGQVGKFSAKMLGLLFARLKDLDDRVADWKLTGTFPRKMPPITNESAATMANYGDARKFKDVQGETKIFEEHMWIDRLYRIHLWRNTNAKTIEIGYVGKHLPTITDPT